MLNKFIKKLSEKKNLSADEMEKALEVILGGGVGEEDIVQFLTLLRDKGETSEEIKGAVITLRKKFQKLPCKTVDVIDTCGTGGDQKGTFNISTASAFVLAGAGIPVAKHGNRAVSSKSGSADVLKACGVNIEVSPEIVARCVDKVGIGFMFAPIYHSTLKVVGGARKKIGTKTIFNILGPLLNPAGAKKQVLGVYDEKLLSVVASVLKELGSESVAVVHGDDGLDELTMTTTSKICFLSNGKIRNEVFDPQSVGYSYCKSEDLVGGDAEQNAKRLKKVLKGSSEAIDHCVYINAALAILVAGRAKDFKEALLLAQDSVSSGRAFRKLEELIRISNFV